MTLSFFDQFNIPNILGIPLIIPALLFPLIIWFTTNRLIQNRYSTIQSSFTFYTTKQMILPINTTGHKWAGTFVTLILILILLNTLGLLPYTLYLEGIFYFVSTMTLWVKLGSDLSKVTPGASYLSRDLNADLPRPMFDTLTMMAEVEFHLLMLSCTYCCELLKMIYNTLLRKGFWKQSRNNWIPLLGKCPYLIWSI